MSVTLYDVDNATKDKTLREACLIKNKKYEVSIIYGAKVLFLSKDIYDQLQLHIKYIRPKFITDENHAKKERYVFVSSHANENRIQTWPSEPFHDNKMHQLILWKSWSF